MKTKVTLIVAVLFLLAAYSFAGGKTEAASAAGAAIPVKLTFSSVSVPGDAHTRAMQVFKLELERISGGEMAVEVYHSGQLFSQEGEQAAVRKGTVDMIYTSPPWLAEFIPYLSMFGAVYTFSGYDHMKAVYNGDLGKRVFQDVVDSQGIRPLGAFYLGTRELNLVEKVGPVRTPADMAGVKLRTPGSPSWIALGKALGGNPTPMSFSEVYMGLKTGAIEGQDNPLPTDKNAKFYEVTKYIVLTDHVVDTIWPTINEKKWQSLTSQQQDWVMQAIKVAGEACDKQVLDTEASIKEFFKAQGMIIIEDVDKAAFQEYAKNSYINDSPDISASWDMDLYNEIQSYK